MTDFLTEAVSHIPSLVGVKFTSSDLADATQAYLLFDKKFEIFYGGETAMLGGLSMGIRSYIGGSFSLVGRPCKRLVEAFDIGDWEQSRSDQVIVLIIVVLFTFTNVCFFSTKSSNFSEILIRWVR